MVITVNQVHERLVTKAIDHVREIVKDTAERIEKHKQDLSLLNAGIFSGNEYFRVLKERQQKPRFDFFVRKGSFFHGYASPDHFQMEENAHMPTGVVPFRFVIKKGIKPSEALAALHHLSFIESGGIGQIAFLEAIQDVLGVEKFDMLFSADSSTPLTIQPNLTNNPLKSLVTAKNPATKKGRLVCIQNTSFYATKHMNGESSCIVTICCNDTPGKETFTALGLPPEGVSRSVVNQKLVEEFNQEPIGLDLVTQEVADRILKSYPPHILARFNTLKNYQQFPPANFSV